MHQHPECNGRSASSGGPRFGHVSSLRFLIVRNLTVVGYPRWGELRLYTERIYDGILNAELPFRRNSITTHDTALIDSPDLTVRRRSEALDAPALRTAYNIAQRAHRHPSISGNRAGHAGRGSSPQAWAVSANSASCKDKRRADSPKSSRPARSTQSVIGPKPPT